jgi:D-alanyl-D-alanine carboxypeptidase
MNSSRSQAALVQALASFAAALRPAHLLGFLVAACLGLAASRAEAGPTLLVDADSGRVLHAIDAFEPWYPASLTKMMTAYVVFRAIEAGRITLDTPVLISEEALRQPPSKMGFPVGTGVTIDDALRMLFVKSANDIAVALAEGVSGSVPAFAEEMNRAAASLGMTGSHFTNPNGLPDERQWTTARDLAVLARAMLKQFPQHASFYSIPAIRIGKRFMRNHNNLLGRYEGVNGIKTGFICASGFNVVTTASRNGRQLIAVVLGAPRAARRAEITAAILEEGFGTFPISLAPRYIDSMRPETEVRARPIDMRPYICGPRKKKMDEETLRMVSVDPRIDLERGRRAIGAKVADSGKEGEDETPATPASAPATGRITPAIATFAPLSSGGEAEADDSEAQLAIPAPAPKPAKPESKQASKPEPKPEAKKPAATKSAAKPAAKASATPKPSKDAKPSGASKPTASASQALSSELKPAAASRPSAASALR